MDDMCQLVQHRVGNLLYWQKLGPVAWMTQPQENLLALVDVQAWQSRMLVLHEIDVHSIRVSKPYQAGFADLDRIQQLPTLSNLLPS